MDTPIPTESRAILAALRNGFYWTTGHSSRDYHAATSLAHLSVERFSPIATFESGVKADEVHCNSAVGLLEYFAKDKNDYVLFVQIHDGIGLTQAEIKRLTERYPEVCAMIRLIAEKKGE